MGRVHFGGEGGGGGSTGYRIQITGGSLENIRNKKC